MTLTPFAERLAVELLQRFLYVVHPTFRLRGARFNPLLHRRGRYVRSNKVYPVWVAGILHSFKSMIIILAGYFHVYHSFLFPEPLI